MPITEYTIMCRDDSTSRWTVTYSMIEANRIYQSEVKHGQWHEVELIARDMESGEETIVSKWQAEAKADA